ncbi:MAG: tRNA pseudouridine(55) synthase TruB [Chloroflexi bacterium]|nr:tRNA pseudouridine(55) synthase TruB [Chloroflexota bacterium]
MDGILNINKPAGKTSFDVVASIRRLSGCRRVGHCGTLDPDATGVLVVCLGRATKIAGMLADSTKQYRAEIQLGTSTDTYDASGKVTFSGDADPITLEEVRQALEQFKGRILQTPPAYSAIKINGRKLYDLARAGVEVNVSSRPVEVFRLEVVSWTPPTLTIEVECSKGTYIRSLAHDLGHALGCGAHLKSLVRTWSGPFAIKDSVTMQEFEMAVCSGYWERFIHPIDSPLLGWPAVILNDQQVKSVLTGRPVGIPNAAFQPRRDGGADAKLMCRAYDSGGALVGLLEFDNDSNTWRGRVVLADAAAERQCACENPCCRQGLGKQGACN